jgi:hypothetical protein
MQNNIRTSQFEFAALYGVLDVGVVALAIDILIRNFRDIGTSTGTTEVRITQPPVTTILLVLINSTLGPLSLRG